MIYTAPGITFEAMDVGDGPGISPLGKRCHSCGKPTCSGADCCLLCAREKAAIPHDAEVFTTPRFTTIEPDMHPSMRIDEVVVPSKRGRRPFRRAT